LGPGRGVPTMMATLRMNILLKADQLRPGRGMPGRSCRRCYAPWGLRSFVGIPTK
jgi:hypothetical protein